jgi:pilus assembly protein CpaE
MTEIRVLIVDDHTQTVDTIARVLQFDEDISLVGTAKSGQEALDLADELDPEVVLMDINLPDTDGLSVTSALLEADPHIQVIILTVRRDMDLLTQAMNEGASGFLLKPPTSEELIGAIRKASNRHSKLMRTTSPIQLISEPPQVMGKVIAVYSGKGGVGCTTLATNLALGLNTVDTPTIIIDCDMQFGDVMLFLNLQQVYSINDLASISLELDRDVIEDVLHDHESGLNVLAAPQRPEMADEVSAESLRNVLEYLRGLFAYVVIDTGTVIDEIALTVFEMADLILTVITPDIPAIKNTRFLIDILNEMGIQDERVLLVLNMVERKSTIIAENIEEHLNHQVAVQIPFDMASVKASINHGVPLLIQGKTLPISKSMIDLVGAVRERFTSLVRER